MKQYSAKKKRAEVSTVGIFSHTPTRMDLCLKLGHKKKVAPKTFARDEETILSDLIRQDRNKNDKKVIMRNYTVRNK